MSISGISSSDHVQYQPTTPAKPSPVVQPDIKTPTPASPSPAQPPIVVSPSPVGPRPAPSPVVQPFVQSPSPASPSPARPPIVVSPLPVAPRPSSPSPVVQPFVQSNVSSAQQAYATVQQEAQQSAPGKGVVTSESNTLLSKPPVSVEA